MTFSEMIQGENGILVKLRLKNYFDEKIYGEIKNYLIVHLEEWKIKGVMPIKDAVAVLTWLIRYRVAVFIGMMMLKLVWNMHLWRYRI